MYPRYTERLTFRLSQPYKDMLNEIAENANRPMSEIARDIFGQSITRRYHRLKSPPTPTKKTPVGIIAAKPMVFMKRFFAATVSSFEKETSSADS